MARLNGNFAILIILSSITHHRRCIGGTLISDLKHVTDTLVPEYILGAPKEILQVKYPLNLSAQLGNVMYYEWIVSKPNLTWSCQPNESYTLIMTNPVNHDLSLEKCRSYFPWFVINIPGCDIEKGEIIFDYEVPRPRWGIGRHYYIYAIFKQPVKKIRAPLDTHSYSSSVPRSRCDFDLKTIAYNLTLGNPFAINYILTNGTLHEHLDPSSSVIFYEDDASLHESHVLNSAELFFRR